MKLSRSRVIAVSSCALMLTATAGLLIAGPLTPPGGPVGATMKTLAEVEPRIALNATNTPGDNDSVFKITQPGSYYLTAKLQGEFGKHGIEIALASQGAVTIDLRGFELAGGTDSLTGVAVTNATPTHVNLRDGTIRFWDQGGANLASVLGATVENVRFLNNYAGGLTTTKSRVINCEASSNSGHGFSLDDGSVIDGCVARLNTQHGIYADKDCTITNGELSNNTQYGVYLEYQGRIVNTNAASNGQWGIGLIRFGSAEGCMLTSNGQGGLYVQGGIVRGCAARDNTSYGFNGSSSHFEECIASYNHGTGIYANGGSTVNRCLSSSNYSHGIDGGGGVQVLDSKIQYNYGEGIRLALDGNTIRGNTCILNATSIDGAGIHMLTADSVIEGNRVTGTDRGIDIDGERNVIIGNWCTGNTINWQFAANNIYGPIVDRSAAATAAVNGNSAVSTMGTTDPHANITY
ncbi:MAG: right-handed parallel beta-helix repeat-containing protein [Phycisphaerales bacterium]|jgi:hypothetical protein|nr:right-handed parallel beta-helix repeat-containing protein [Phycisphaerales bacterium]